MMHVTRIQMKSLCWNHSTHMPYPTNQPPRKYAHTSYQVYYLYLRHIRDLYLKVLLPEIILDNDSYIYQILHQSSQNLLQNSSSVMLYVFCPLKMTKLPPPSVCYITIYKEKAHIYVDYLSEINVRQIMNIRYWDYFVRLLISAVAWDTYFRGEACISSNYVWDCLQISIYTCTDVTSYISSQCIYVSYCI